MALHTGATAKIQWHTKNLMIFLYQLHERERELKGFRIKNVRSITIFKHKKVGRIFAEQLTYV